MNLFDKIKDAFSNEDEKAAEAAKAAEEQAAADAQAAQDEANRIAAEQEAAAAEEASAAADAQRIADEVAAIEAANAEKAAAEQAAADAAAAEAAAAEAAAAAAAAAPVDNRPALSVAYVLQLIHHDADPSVATGDAMDAGTGQTIENALAQVIDYAGPIDGALGTSFVRAYARFQQSLGYSGADADGYPGIASLTALGDRTGAFRAVD